MLDFEFVVLLLSHVTFWFCLMMTVSSDLNFIKIVINFWLFIKKMDFFQASKRSKVDNKSFMIRAGKFGTCYKLLQLKNNFRV